ncbi:MAG TPA: ECF transporter S component [Acidobacteriota bacterium]|nr:ECF transporter S component [Acidobacteriota bacterium]
MIGEPRIITRIALFSALVYVLSWAFAPYPNVNLIFFVIFTAGFLWGVTPGVLVGLIGTGLWTAFNPYGPATWPVMLAQVSSAAVCGLVGAWYARTSWRRQGPVRRTATLVIVAVVCTYAYYLPVSAVDAWVFQPFWPRFLTSLVWSLVSVVSNALIFPLLFGVTRYLYDREQSRLCQDRR